MSVPARARLRALVVHESMFGNTRALARAVAEGLSASMDVEVVQVGLAPPPDESLDLVVLGAPTHAFSMSRPATRSDAVRQGAPAADVERGLREWLADQGRSRHRPRVATFDTRVSRARRVPGSAAKAAARAARAHGFELSAAPVSFFVDDVPGPLAPGELERARDWGRHLGEAVSAAPARRAVRR